VKFKKLGFSVPLSIHFSKSTSVPIFSINVKHTEIKLLFYTGTITKLLFEHNEAT